MDMRDKSPLAYRKWSLRVSELNNNSIVPPKLYIVWIFLFCLLVYKGEAENGVWPFTRTLDDLSYACNIKDPKHIQKLANGLLSNVYLLQSTMCELNPHWQWTTDLWVKALPTQLPILPQKDNMVYMYDFLMGHSITNNRYAWWKSLSEQKMTVKGPCCILCLLFIFLIRLYHN